MEPMALTTAREPSASHQCSGVGNPNQSTWSSNHPTIAVTLIWQLDHYLQQDWMALKTKSIRVNLKRLTQGIIAMKNVECEAYVAFQLHSMKPWMSSNMMMS